MKHIKGCSEKVPAQGVLHSPCEACRAQHMIGPVSQKGCELKPLVSWEQKPYINAELIVSQVKQRRGA